MAKKPGRGVQACAQLFAVERKQEHVVGIHVGRGGCLKCLRATEVEHDVGVKQPGRGANAVAQGRGSALAGFAMGQHQIAAFFGEQAQGGIGCLGAYDVVLPGPQLCAESALCAGVRLQKKDLHKAPRGGKELSESLR